MGVRLASLLGRRRSGVAYDRLRPQCTVRNGGTVVLPARVAFQFCVRRCVATHRRNEYLVRRHEVMARLRAWNDAFDRSLGERVRANALWMRCMRRARARVRRAEDAWNDRLRAWHASEGARKETCCGVPRIVCAHARTELRECRACNLGVPSVRCQCYFSDVTEHEHTCAVCGDVFAARPFGEPNPQWHQLWRRRFRFDANRQRFPRLSRRYSL